MLIARPASFLQSASRQHLHVARQHDQLDLLLVDDFEQPPLLLLLGLGRHRQVVERDVVARRELIEGAVVRDDGRDLDGQRADLVAVEQVVEAVAELRDEDQHARLLGVGVKLRRHAVLLDGRHQRLPGVVAAEALRRRERHAHEKAAAFHVAELGAIGDVAAVAREPHGDGRHDAGAIGAG